MADSSSIPQRLVLAQLGEGWPRLTPSMGQIMAEAASVCLEEQGHCNGVHLSVQGKLKVACSLHWSSITDQVRSTHNDLQDATEMGACGIALLITREFTEYTVVERARKGVGFDYWLGYKDDPLFQKRARLEVSGILAGNESSIKARVQQKREQTNPSDYLQMEAYIIIVEFSEPTAQVETK